MLFSDADCRIITSYITKKSKLELNSSSEQAHLQLSSRKSHIPKSLPNCPISTAFKCFYILPSGTCSIAVYPSISSSQLPGANPNHIQGFEQKQPPIVLHFHNILLKTHETPSNTPFKRFSPSADILLRLVGGISIRGGGSAEKHITITVRLSHVLRLSASLTSSLEHLSGSL